MCCLDSHVQDRISNTAKRHFRSYGFTLSIFLLLMVISPFTSVSSFAQDVSLSSDDTVDDLKVTCGGREMPVTVIRDANNEKQWYYIPTRPRLLETVSGGIKRPVLSLYRYQFENPDKQGELLEGGLLQLSASLSLTPEAIESLKEQLASKIGVDKNRLTLSALRMKSAKVHVYCLGPNGVFVRTPPDGNGDAPIFTTQEMAFSIDLTKIGTSLYKALIEGGEGLKIQVDYTYGGLTPPAGFTVRVDYRQLHKHYSRNEQFAVRASYFGYFGGSYKRESTEIREALEQSGALQIDVKEGSGLKKEDIDKYLQPILKRINDEVIQLLSPPAQIDPAKAQAGSSGGIWGGANYAVAIKDVSQLRQLNETIKLNYRIYEERTTSASSTISVADYPEEIRRSLLLTVSNLNWESAYFHLPLLNIEPDSGVDQVDLTMTLMSGDRRLPDRSFSWKGDAGWVDVQTHKPTSGTIFPLLGEGFTGDVLRNAKYVTDYRFTSRGKNFSYSITNSAFSGGRPLTVPTQGIDRLIIDGSNLTFKDMEDAGKNPAEIDRKKLKLLKVTVVLDSQQDKPIPPIELKSTKENNVVVSCKPKSVFLVNPDFVPSSSPVSMKLTFYLSNGDKVSWKGNTSDLRKDYPDLNVNLVDNHWDPSLN